MTDFTTDLRELPGWWREQALGADAAMQVMAFSSAKLPEPGTYEQGWAACYAAVTAALGRITRAWVHPMAAAEAEKVLAELAQPRR